MPRSTFSGGISSPKVNVVVDLGNPFLNHALDGFLKIGTVGALRVAAEETYHSARRGSISSDKFEHTKNALIGGAITGALVSAANNNNRDTVLVDAITGAAMATAAKFLIYRT